MRTEEFENCTLYLGNSLEIISELEPNSVDMIFTDPPYGHNNNNGDLISKWEKALSKTGKFMEERPIQNDGPEANDLFETVFLESKRVLKKEASICCCCNGGGGPDPQFARWSLYLDKLFNFKQMVIFDKGPMGMGWHYRRSYETVLVAEQGKPKWHDESGKIENIIRPGQYGIKKIIPSHLDHPTPKPPELAMHFINLHTLPGEMIFDPFMGGGSTGIAASKLQRKFIGIEIEQKWFDLACRRIENEARQGQLF